MTPTVLSRAEVLVLLGGRRALIRALEEGRWQRVLTGTYTPGDTTVDVAVRCRAALLLLPDRARVADRCLLWLLGVDVMPPGPPVLEVVVPRGVVPARRQGVRARSALIPASDACLLQPYGLPCLRPARAIADCLRSLPRVEAVIVADAVLHAELCTAVDLRDELTRHAGLRGVRQAGRALDIADPRAESPPETRVRLALVAAGLAPVPQHEVHHEGRLVARVDFAFPEVRLAIEYDGREVHEREDVFTRDRRRHNDLVRAGWTVLRFTADDLHDVDRRIVEVVRAALAQLASAS